MTVSIARDHHTTNTFDASQPQMNADDADKKS